MRVNNYGKPNIIFLLSLLLFFKYSASEQNRAAVENAIILLVVYCSWIRTEVFVAALRRVVQTNLQLSAHFFTVVKVPEQKSFKRQEHVHTLWDLKYIRQRRQDVAKTNKKSNHHHKHHILVIKDTKVKLHLKLPKKRWIKLKPLKVMDPSIIVFRYE